MSDDLGQLHQQKGAILEENEALLDTFRTIGSGQPQAEGITAKGVAKDVARGVTELPKAVVGGVLGAFEQLDQTARDVAVWAEKKAGVKLGGVVLDENGVRLASSDEVYAKDTEAAIQALIPDVAKPQSTTGRMARGVAQFLAGFVLAGKVPGLGALSNAGKVGTVAAATAKGALSDFSAMEAQGGALSQLFERFPRLSNPVTRYLAGDPSDDAVELRFRQSLEGMGFGLLTEGFLHAVRTLRAARAAKAGVEGAGAGIDEALGEAAAKAGAQKQRLTDLLGDPDGPVVVRPKGPEALEVDALDGIDTDAAARALANAKGDARDIFVNWARINSEDDVKAVIQDMADAFGPGIDTARRGVRSHEATRLSADQLNAWEVLSQRRAGQPLNAEQSLAVRELWVRSGTKLRDLAQQVVADPGSEMNRVAFRKMVTVHNAIQEQVIAARTETARALNSWRIPAGEGVGFIGQVENLAELARADRTIERAAEGIVDLAKAGYDAEADAFIYALPLAQTREQVAAIWYASLLSGPKTHARNILGSLSSTLLQVPERKLASLLGKVVGDVQVPDGEATALLFGHVQGFKDALRVTAKGLRILRESRGLAPADAQKLLADNADEIGTAWRTAATGETGIGIGKIEAPIAGAFSPERVGLGRDSPGYAAFFDFIDTVVSAPTRALAIEDEVFKTSAFRAEMNAQALRQVRREVETGALSEAAAPERIAQLLTDPTDSLRFAASQYAQVSTFTNAPLNTRAWNAWSSAANLPVFGKLLIPFRRTPWNIGTFTFRRTLVAPFMQSWQADIRAGGARAQLAWAQFITGNALLLAFTDLAINGQITGEGSGLGPEQETMRRTGWQPNSVRVGDRYFSYRGVEPFGSHLGIAANATEILAHTDWDDDNQDADELAIAASMAIASQVTSQQYMSGVSAFFDAMSDPRRYGESWFDQLFRPAVPTGVAEIARAMDPTARMAFDISDQLRARTPGLSKDLPPLRDLWGRPITRASGLGPAFDALSPSASTRLRPEPIDAELARLEKWIGKPKRRQTFDGVPIDLEAYPRAYDRLIELTGHGIADPSRGYTGPGGMLGELNALVSRRHPLSPVYELMTDGPDGGKAQQIEQIVGAYTALARARVVTEFPEVRVRVDTGRAKRVGKFDFGLLSQ